MNIKSIENALNAAMDCNHAVRELMQALALDGQTIISQSLYRQRISLAMQHIQRAKDWASKADMAAVE